MLVGKLHVDEVAGSPRISLRQVVQGQVVRDFHGHSHEQELAGTPFRSLQLHQPFPSQTQEPF